MLTNPILVLILVALALPAQSPDGHPRPNFVFILTDDISPDDLACYGHPTIATPNIDRLAREGVRFTNAYLTTSSCSPSRCSIITGRYPHNTGAPELHTPLPRGQFMFPQALREHGYHTVLSGKNHMGPAVDAAFDDVRKGKGPGKEGDWVEVLRERPRDKPFFCWFASTDAHRDWQTSKHAKRYASEDVVVPPFLFDGPETRADLAAYYHEVSRTDWFVGEVLEELAAQGIAENTYVIYASDNGRPFPRCKTRLYDSGVKMPLLVWRAGSERLGVAEGLISAIDLGPTFLELAGLDIDERAQGVSFARALSVSASPTTTTREWAFAEHNWHVFQAHERMVRHGDWLLIRNSWPEHRAMCVESSPRFPAGAELWQMEAAGKLMAAQRDVFAMPRPPVELYRCSSDPHQLDNLADDERFAAVRDQLLATLDEWAAATGDTVPDDPTPDRETAHGKKRPGFARGTFPGASREATQINDKGPH